MLRHSPGILFLKKKRKKKLNRREYLDYFCNLTKKDKSQSIEQKFGSILITFNMIVDFLWPRDHLKIFVAVLWLFFLRIRANSEKRILYISTKEKKKSITPIVGKGNRY